MLVTLGISRGKGRLSDAPQAMQRGDRSAAVATLERSIYRGEIVVPTEEMPRDGDWNV